MINSKANIQRYAAPFKWIQIEEIFRNVDKIALSETYPTDNYRTIEAKTDTRQYSYDVRALVGLDGKIKKQSGLSAVWREFGEYLLSPEYRKFVSEISEVDVTGLSFEANVYKYSKDCFMDAHTDLDTKILTHVFYFNARWNMADGGCFNILKSENIQDVSKKISPVIGNSVMIIRANNSWHSVDKTICEKSRRSVTVTFYKKGADSPMWIDGQSYDLHENKK